MGRKIFVSYKFADDQVENLDVGKNSTVRDYVTEFENLLDSTDHIYKGEGVGEDLSTLSEDMIWEKLKERIYDSSITIVFISLGMKEKGKKDKDQWIPWEVSYSLKETSRKNKNGQAVTSKTNAMIAVVLPDTEGSYSYYLEEKNCGETCHCVIHHRGNLFQIIKDNMFNCKKPTKKICDKGYSVWYGNDVSYIVAVKWCDFKQDYSKYIDAACKRQDNMQSYEIVKTIS